jgi:hypothetical protein
MRANQQGSDGKFCRGGINCRGQRSLSAAENPCFIGFFELARRLLILTL